MSSLEQMENRAVMAETMLEATLQYQSGQQKAQLPSPSPSPRYHNGQFVELFHSFFSIRIFFPNASRCDLTY